MFTFRAYLIIVNFARDNARDYAVIACKIQYDKIAPVQHRPNAPHHGHPAAVGIGGGGGVNSLSAAPPPTGFDGYAYPARRRRSPQRLGVIN